MKYFAIVLLTVLVAVSCSKKDHNKDSVTDRSFNLELDSRTYSWTSGVQLVFEPVKRMTIFGQEADHSILMELTVHNDTLGTYTTTSIDTTKALEGKIEFIETADPHYGRWKLVTNDESRKGTLTVDVFTNYDYRGTFSGVFRNSDDTTRYLQIKNGVFAMKLQ